MAETEANFDKLTDVGKASFNERKALLAEVERTRLKSPDELPELPGGELVFAWDFQSGEGEHWQTVIRHGERILRSETAVYEGGHRFAEIVALLRQRYGSRLVDLVPTPGSSTYLYGDDGSTIGAVQRARDSLQPPPEKDQRKTGGPTG
jgi:hypothetical protein